MSLRSRHLLTAIILASLNVLLGWCLSGCGKNKGEAEASKKTPTTEASSVSQWISNSTSIDWWKAQAAQGTDFAKATKESLESIKVDDLRKQVSDLTKALEAEDWKQIESLAGKMGENLSVEKLTEGFRFVVIQRQKGGDAATKAIEYYTARKDLGEFEKVAAENLKKGMALLQREDLQGYTVLAIFYACECKLGAHQGALLAVPIISILFPDYIEKHGASANVKL